jgi:uncharacterized protein
MTLAVALGLVASVIMGLALGLTGGGGSILTVPILVYLFGVSALTATTYSLVIVGSVALWGSWTAYKNDDLKIKTALTFGIPGIAGVALSRNVLLTHLPNQISFFGQQITKNSFLLICFAILMLAASISMIKSSSISAPDTKNDTTSDKTITLAFMGSIVGIVAGFVGAGGGFLIVPALVYFSSLNMKKAVGTSLLVIALQSLLGVATNPNLLEALDYKLLVMIILLAAAGMSIGTKLRHRVPNKNLKLGFGLFVLIMGVIIFIKEFNRGVN